MIKFKAYVNSMNLTWSKMVVLSNSPWQSIVNCIINFQDFFSFGKVYIDRLIENVKHIFGRMYLDYSQNLSTYLNKTPKILPYLSQPRNYGWWKTGMDKKLA